MAVGPRRVYLFADEAGNFDFSVKQGASRYFILGSIAVESPSVGADLLALRRELAWQGHGLDSAFHATEDKQAVRIGSSSSSTPPTCASTRPSWTSGRRSRSTPRIRRRSTSSPGTST